MGTRSCPNLNFEDLSDFMSGWQSTYHIFCAFINLGDIAMGSQEVTIIGPATPNACTSYSKTCNREFVPA